MTRASMNCRLRSLPNAPAHSSLRISVGAAWQRWRRICRHVWSSWTSNASAWPALRHGWPSFRRRLLLRQLRQSRGLAFSSLAELSQNTEVFKLLEAELASINRGLASYETIKKFAILPSDFSIDAGELTPSLKMKRKEIEKRNKDVLDGFYAGDKGAAD